MTSPSTTAIIKKMKEGSLLHQFEERIKKYHVPLMPLIWGMTCLVIAILLGIGLRQYFSAEKAVAEQFNTQQLMLAQQAARGIESYLAEIQEVATLLTRDPEVRSFARGISPQTLKDLYKGFHGKIHFLFFCDPRGSLRSAFPKENFHQMLGEPLYGQDFLDQARARGKPLIRTVSTSADSSAIREGRSFEVVLIIAPIYRGATFLGIMGCGLDISKINQVFVNSIRSGVTGGAWMINSEGRFIAHDDPTMIGKDAFAACKARDGRISTEKIDRIMREEMLKGKTGKDEYVSGWHRGKREETRKLIAYAPVQVDEQIWSIAVVCPYSDVTHVVWGSFRNSAWLLGIMAIVLLAGTYVGHKINQGRIRAEEKLRWNEEVLKTQARLQTIIDGAPDAIAIVDRKFRLTMLNRTGLNWYGRSLQEFQGRFCYKEFQGRQDLCPNCPAEETFRTGQPAFRMRASLVARGRKRYLQIFTYPLKNRSGEVEEIVEYVKDVTAERELQQKIIQNERLAVVGRMAANVAHEIKNPLGTIVLNVELLEEELQDLGLEGGKEARSLLATIRSEIDRLLEVIGDYLQFARLPEVRLEKGSVNQVLSDLLQFLKEEIIARNILIVQELSPALPPVAIDAHQLRQAFLNLIKNSLEAMPGGGKLTIRTVLRNGHVEIQVGDTGRGIAEKNTDLIFTPFFSTKPGGTGLGLPITAHIVMEHRGQIHFESDPDLGTTFSIRLPIDSSGPTDAWPRARGREEEMIECRKDDDEKQESVHGTEDGNGRQEKRSDRG